MYRIDAHWGLVRRRGKNVDAHVYWVNDEAVGTTIREVQQRIQGPTNEQIAKACIRAKEDGSTVHLRPSVMGWVMHK